MRPWIKAVLIAIAAIAAIAAGGAAPALWLTQASIDLPFTGPAGASVR